VAHAVVGSRKVYYEFHGDHPGTPLVLVNGMGGSCRGWLPLQVPDFSQRHRTLIFDHRGVGGSEATDGPFSIVDLADDLIGLLDALEIERADVLGVFMGGMIAQELAIRHPDRLRRMVLAGTFARADAKRRMILQQWRDLSLGGASIELLVRERLLWTLQDETLEQTDLIEQMLAFFTRDGAPLTEEVFAQQCEAALAHNTADRLRQITSETLVICGRRDQLTPASLHRELADEIPNAHLVTIRYGGHMVMAESAESFNHAVLQFLAEGDEDV
jgi:pimeloyl-ACP methyl ester carboxylesterase